MKALISALVLIAATTFTPVASAESYLCIADQAAGFKYDETQKEWESMTFSTNSKYIIKPTTEYDKAYRVDRFGDPIGIPISWCDKPFNDWGWITCTMDGRFRFNKKSLRFIRSFDVGYAQVGIIEELTDEKSDTPYMEIGKCSEI